MSPSTKATRPRKSVSKTKDAPARTRKDAPKKRAVGRPSAFQSGYAEQSYKLALLGATDAQMADIFGVHEATLHRWKHEHSEFRESIKRGKVDADANVAESLYRAAIGGGVLTDTKELTDAEGKVTRTREVKQVPANVTAMIFWLKNRQPDKWRDRVEHQAALTVSGPGGEELLRLFNDRMQQARERQEAVKRERGILDDGQG